MYLEKCISRIGLGCVTFGREIDESQSFCLMDHALDSGITFFDTASSYNNGTSEVIIGNWLASRRLLGDQIMVATKISPPYTAERLSKFIHQSLKRLRLDSLDLLYLHCWDNSIKTDKVLTTLDNFIKEGKVACLGASNFTVDQLQSSVNLQKKLELDHFKFAQNNHNYAVSDLSPKFTEVCTNNEIEVVTYSPLGAGFLTGKYYSGIPADSRFEIIPGHKNVYFNEHAFKKLDHLKKVAKSTGYSMIHLALAWALHQSGVKTVLIGGRHPRQLDQAFEALKIYDQDIFRQLDEISLKDQL